MAKRKGTPNVLAEILGGTEEMNESLTTRRPLSPERSIQWDYQVVSFQDYRGWRPRFINGAEIHDWTNGPLLHDFLAEMGEEGWELAAASSGERLYGSADHYQFYFKRPARED